MQKVRVTFVVLIAGAAALIAERGSCAEPIRVALGKIEITPPVGSPMAGYSARKGKAESIHDPLWAKLMLVEGEEASLAFITFDLRRITSPRIIEGLNSLGIGHVILAASHTHSGPNADDESFPTPSTSWKHSVEERVIDLAKRAREQSFPAKLAVGRSSIFLGHNRRAVDASGNVTMLWRNEDRIPTYPLDPTVTVIRIDDDRGEPRAALVHYACHPVVLGPDNLAISADYPGAMRDRLAELIADDLGNDIEVFFLQGAAGDINPYNDKQPIDQGGFEEMARVGAELASMAFGIYQRIGDRLAPIEALRISARSFDFENRWDRERRVDATLTTALLGEDLALIAVPGEPFIEFQLSLTGRSPVANSLLVGYAVSGRHEWPGYIPTIEAATQGGYGAGYNTTIEVGAGEWLIDQAIIQLYTMTGMLDANLQEN